MSVIVIKQGLLDSLQDEGRFGYQHLGINPGGSMDPIAARFANMLVGNERTCAVMELHFPAASLLFEERSIIAITGADFSAVVNNEPVETNSSIIVPANSVLKFMRYKNGCRCYLGIYGGWNAELWLNSYSTNMKVFAGGYAGSSLRTKDVIQVNRSSASFRMTEEFASPHQVVKTDLSHLYSQTKKIRCVAGSDYDWLDNHSKNKFESSAFTITSESDRMGFRLHGELLKNANGEDLLSAAVTRGTIQLLPSGQLIILMADHQTTGGYP
ncbi:MAG TPA: biotin-dependent carboxyltransferase family protein, partial [Parafilimonas sp.]|nr:biotin-dependent carboxyltransferase family protein [Parafilimonas sp.]